MGRRLKDTAEMHLWLSRIIDDLNPADFSARELIEEFGAVGGAKASEKDSLNGEQHIRTQLARLVKNEYVENIAKGRYSVTQAGMSFRDGYSEG